LGAAIVFSDRGSWLGFRGPTTAGGGPFHGPATMRSMDHPENPARGGASDRIARAHDKAFVLYEGKRTPHRSCGICLAETFGLASRSYQALRRGGITGAGECGAIKAGELVLGEILGSPDPTGPVTDALRAAAMRYRDVWRERLRGHVGTSLVCNDLTSPFTDFAGPDRLSYCTRIAAEVAAAVATVLEEMGVEVDIQPPELDAPDAATARCDPRGSDPAGG
jgi:hypothetical protein